jgi:hypothetical protein
VRSKKVKKAYLLAGSIGLLGLMAPAFSAVAAETSPSIQASEPSALSEAVAQANPAESVQADDNSIAQVTSVSELSDVQPTDWAFQAVQSLVERYGCIEGYPDRTFRGNRAATRYELAAALNACLNAISERFVTAEDLATIRQLQEEFAAELATLRGRVDALEARTAELEANQFSTTTKLNGEAIFAPYIPFGGGVEDDDDDDDDDIDSNVALGYRVRLNFDTSFTGEDRLRVRLQARDVENLTGITGTQMARLGFDGDNDGTFEIDDLYYRFPLGDRGNAYLAAYDTDFNDAFNVFNPYLDSSGSGAISRFGRFNPIYRQGGGSGLLVNYDLTDQFRASFGYLADTDNAQDIEAGGLFNGGYAALAQLGFQANDAFGIGLTYVRSFEPEGNVNLTGSTGSEVAQDPFNGSPTIADHFGVQSVISLGRRFAISGWAGYTLAREQNLSDDNADLLNYAVALNFPDLGREGNLGAIIFGQPPKVVDSNFGLEEDDTSYHLEGLYKFRVSDNIAITPGVLAIFNPEHNAENDTVFVGTIRTTFSF